MARDLLVVGLSLAAAFFFAVSSSLKHVSAACAPDAQTLQLGKLAQFVRATLTHRLWLGGIGCDVAGLALQIVALHLGALAVVQPLLISGLLFALIVRQRFERRRIAARQLAWAAGLTASLAGFLLLAGMGSNSVPHQPVDRMPAAVAALVGAALIVMCIGLGRRQRGGGRAAALLGVAVGTIYAVAAALLKALTDIAVRSPFDALVSWQLYTVVLLGAAGLLLNQLALQAGPLTASLPAEATVDPLFSIVIGVVVYDEHIRGGPGAGAALIGLLLVMGLAVIQLLRTPELVEPPSPLDRHPDAVLTSGAGSAGGG